jgi:hypothetical protein
MNGAEAPENRVRVLRRALMYFSGVVLPEAKFRFIWPYHAHLVDVPADAGLKSAWRNRTSTGGGPRPKPPSLTSEQLLGDRRYGDTERWTS